MLDLKSYQIIIQKKKMSENLFARTKNECKLNFKNNYCLTITDDWLDQCIEYVLEDNQVCFFLLKNVHIIYILYK